MKKFKRICYVACLDIAGFKKMVENDQDELLYSFFEEAKKEKQSFLQCSNSDIVMFSDSIFVVAKDMREESYEDVVYSSLIFCRVALDRGIPINGAISCGEMVYKDHEICFGKAIIDAHKLQEKLFLYSVVLSENVINQRKTPEIINPTFPHTPIIETKIYLKDSENDRLSIEGNRYVLNIGEIFTDYKLPYVEQIPKMREVIQVLWNKHKSDDQRINQYIMNTEQSFKEWYDFAAKEMGFNGWGDIICK